MKILVAIKRVVDANVRVRINADQSGVDIDNVKMVINPFCEIALEEAISLKESGAAGEVIAVSVGPDHCQEQLRMALALGADRALQVATDALMQPLTIAKLLNEVIKREQPDLIILGKQSIDGDNNQTGQMLAALAGLPQATFASQLTFLDTNGISELEVIREVDGGLQTIAMTLPAVVTTDLRLNEPRYVSLPNLMKAKRKPIEQLAADELGVDLSARLSVKKVANPPQRSAATMVASVEQLVEKLRTETGVLS